MRPTFDVRIVTTMPAPARSSAIEVNHLDAAARAIRATLVGDSRVVGELFASDALAFLSLPLRSATALAVEIEDRLGAFSDVDVTIVNARSIADEVWMEWTASVRHLGQLVVDDLVIEPTGRTVALHGVTALDFGADGRIVGYRQYWDTSTLRARATRATIDRAANAAERARWGERTSMQTEPQASCRSVTTTSRREVGSTSSSVPP
jgi:hypothetical protein